MYRLEPSLNVDHPDQDFSGAISRTRTKPTRRSGGAWGCGPISLGHYPPDVTVSH